MIIALAFTAGSILIFLLVAYAASVVAKRHHYYEDPDEDKQHIHHGPHGETVWLSNAGAVEVQATK